MINCSSSKCFISGKGSKFKERLIQKTKGSEFYKAGEEGVSIRVLRCLIFFACLPQGKILKSKVVLESLNIVE